MQLRLAREKGRLSLGPGTGRLHILPHELPVNSIPPRVQKLALPPDAIVTQPNVLPGVDTQERHHIYTTERLLWPVVHAGGRAKGTDFVQLLV